MAHQYLKFTRIDVKKANSLMTVIRAGSGNGSDEASLKEGDSTSPMSTIRRIKWD